MRKEHLIIDEDSRETFVSYLLDLASRCLDFKVGSTFSRPPDSLRPDRIAEVSRIRESGQPLSDIIEEFAEDIASHSLNFGASGFLAHPDNGIAMAAVLGDFARSLLNQNLVSHEYSPAATRVEFELLQQLRRLTGFPMVEESCDSVLQAGGAFVFGGTGANLACLLAAREKLKLTLRQKGREYDPRRVRVLTKCPFAHYSLRRSILLLGLGNGDLTEAERARLGLAADARLDVATTNYVMDPADLERKILQVHASGEDILCVFAVAGDSRMMSFDSLRAIGDVCARHGVWLHVDACEGGQCLFSPRRRHLFDGLELANSVSLDPHKVLMLPYPLSAFFLRDQDDLGLIDIGTTVIRLGSSSFGTVTPAVGSKDFASLKLWFLLKHWGWRNIAAEIDRRHELAKFAAALVRGSGELRLINDSVVHNAVAFMYCPDEIHQHWSTSEINSLNQLIHDTLNAKGRYFVHAMAAKDDNAVISQEKRDVTILRMMFGNPRTTEEDVSGCIDEVVRLGRAYASDPPWVEAEWNRAELLATNG